MTRAGLSIPEALGKLSIGGPLPTYVKDQKKKRKKGHHHLLSAFQTKTQYNFDY